MADLASLYGGMTKFGFPSGTVTPANVTMTGTGIGWGAIFESETTDAITHLGFLYGARGSSTPAGYTIGLEGVSVTTGAPDGTYKGGGSPASGTFTPPDDTSWNSTWQWVALTNSYAPAAYGENLALTVRYASGTNNSETFTTDVDSFVAATTHGMPYASRLSAGTWTHRARPPIFGYRTASGRFGHIYQSTYQTNSASTVGHRVAMKFTLPAGSGDTFKLRGFRAFSRFAAAGKNPLAKIWNASAAEASKTLDTDIIATTATTLNTRTHIFTTRPTLSFGTTYYIGYEVADASSGELRINGIQLASGDDLQAHGLAGNFHLATYNGSVWADDTTVRPLVELLFDDITEPAGGGGGGPIFGLAANGPAFRGAA